MLLDNLIDFFITYGYFAVFSVLLLCGFGFPVPEDITLVAGGVISSMVCSSDAGFLQAIFDCNEVHVMFFVSMAGVLIGDSIMFLMGYIFGTRLLKFRFFARIVTENRYAWIQNKFTKYGVLVIFAGRFMPGLRSPIFVVTGISKKVSYIKFLMTDGFAALISVPIWVYLGFWGERQLSDMSSLEKYVKRGQISLFVFIAVVILIIFAFWFIKRKIKQKTNID